MKKLSLFFLLIALCSVGFAQTEIYGCTDPGAVNYNPDATIDDGSCCTADNYITVSMDVPQPEYAFIAIWSPDGNYYFDGAAGTSFCLPDGCYSINASYQTNDIATYTINVTDANGTVLQSASMSNLDNIPLNISLNATPGCMDYGACNYSPSATCNDACDYSCFGCTDPAANNYNANATIDDGSCCTHEYTLVADMPVHWQLYSNSTSYFNSGDFPESNGFCAGNGCYTFCMYFDFLPDNPTGIINWQILDVNGNIAYSGTTDQWGSNGTVVISNDATSGCADMGACNYDSNVNCPDYTMCDYSCLGCTDPTAPNYTPGATVDNGTCCTENWYEIEASEPGYWDVMDAMGIYMSGHWPEETGFCMSEGCLVIEFYSDDFASLNSTITVTHNGVEVASGSGDQGWLQLIVDNGSVAGCMDASACNYDPLATCPDYNVCDYSCLGCTDATAPNYNPEATMNDGSCCYQTWYTLSLDNPATWCVNSMNGNFYAWGNYPEQNGFCADGTCFSLDVWSMDGNPVNYHLYDPNGAEVASGTSSFLYGNNLVLIGDAVTGCADSYACNYNPEATCNDYYSCDYSCYGCTDPNAPNYDPEATSDNGSCCTADWYTLNFSAPVSWWAQNINGEFYGGEFPYDDGFCMSSGCFYLEVLSYDLTPVNYTITDASGNIIQSGVTSGDYYAPISISLDGSIAGCLDPGACNYNPESNCDDGSCMYFCGGCLDPSALNYNPNAMYDDGSCIYQVEPPQMGMTMVPDDANNQFYILMNMMDEGNGAPYVMRSDYNDDATFMDQSGQYLSGPYPCDQSIAFTLQSIQAGLETYLTTSIDGACAIVNSVKNEISTSQLSLFPNPNNGTFVISNINASRAQIRISDMSGRVVMDELRIIANGRYEMNSDQLTNGVYQVSVITDGNASTVKMIVRK